MKSFLLVAGVFWSLATTCLPAQTTNAPSAGSPHLDSSPQHRTIGFLPQADQDRLEKAFNQAQADHPEFKVEEDKIGEDIQVLSSASPEERQAFMERLRMHQQKLREAMLKEDPSIAPLLKRVDKHMSEMIAERQKEMSSGAPSAAPSGSVPAPASTPAHP